MTHAAHAGYEIVDRQDFSDVTFLLEVRHPMLAKAARAGQFVIVMASERGERIPLTIADYDRDAGTITLVIQAVGKTTREMQRDLEVGRSPRRAGGADGHPEPRRPGEEGAVRGRRPRRGARVPAGARLEGERRLRDRRPRLPQQGPGVLGGQVPRLLRRAHPLHRRRLGRHQGPGHRRNRAGNRQAPRHRGVRRDRPAGDDEGLRRGDPAAQDQDHGQPQPGDGRRHGHVRRLSRQDRRGREIRLRRRPGLRRPPGRFRRPHVPPASATRRPSAKLPRSSTTIAACAASRARREARADHGDRQRAS